MALRFLLPAETLHDGPIYGAVVDGRASCQSPAMVAELEGTGVTPSTGPDEWGAGVVGGLTRVCFAFQVSGEMAVLDAQRAIFAAAERAQAEPRVLSIRGDTVQMASGAASGALASLGDPLGTRDPRSTFNRLLGGLHDVTELPGTLVKLGGLALAAYVAFRIWGPK